MIKNYYSLFIIVLLTVFTQVNAQDAPVLTYNIPAQNNLKYNRFLQNPTFSFVREDNTYITMYHRNQWIQYDDSPKAYLLAYSGRFTDRAGLGFGIYQQNKGVITSFGGIANYSYNVKIREALTITLGFNFAYYNSGIDKNRVITESPDPILMAMRNNSLLSIKPGFNISYKQFDFGFYAENFVDYDFKSNKMATDYADKTYSGHIMYTHKMVDRKDLFEDSEFRIALRAKTSQEYGFGVNGSVLLDFPKFGWMQTGLDNYYGVAVGVGFHLTKRLSLGYTFERTTKEGLVNLGPTHEITMVFSFKDRNALKEKNKTEKDSLAKEKKLALKDSLAVEKNDILKDSLAEGKPGDKKPDFDKNLELEKLKMDLDEDSMHLLDALVKEDSLAKIKKAEFEEKVKNLLDYAKKEKAAKAMNPPLVLKNLTTGKETIVPKTLEDLKKAPDGYYVVSKDINAKDDDKTVKIEKHPTFTEAANASEKKKASGKEKNVYIVHVDNTPDLELHNEIINENTLQNEKNLQNQSPDSIANVSKDKKGENLKTEEEIKEFYAGITNKPRETLKKMNKLSVEGIEPGYYIIANVFSTQENTDNFMKKLKDKGIESGYFLNPKNKFRYVYLKKHNIWREALISYYSNVDNVYFDPIWIMSVNAN